MKVIILAGGRGSRLGEETANLPKPMIEIGGFPIMWHIMKIFAHWGFNEFIPALGYKGNIIKQYFLNYFHQTNDITVKIQSGEIENQSNPSEDWIIHLLNTGINTQTGGRIRRAMKFANNESVFATYGDGLADINLKELLRFHQNHGRLATVTAVHPPSRFGSLDLNGDSVASFAEKLQIKKGWINGGFFVFNPEVKDYIACDDIPLESDPLINLAKEGQLMAFRHDGFWQPMDTIREKGVLNQLWKTGKPPWKVWK